MSLTNNDNNTKCMMLDLPHDAAHQTMATQDALVSQYMCARSASIANTNDTSIVNFNTILCNLLLASYPSV